MKICGFSGKTLTKRQVSYALNKFRKTARVGIEIEGNIPEESFCRGCKYFSEPCYCTNYEVFNDEEDEEERVQDTDCSRMRRGFSGIYREIADELGCEVGHGVYSEGRDFQYVYYDGSVNIELVTGAIELPRVREVLSRGYKTLEAYDVKLSPFEQAGGHQTVSYNGSYHKPVAMNVVQLVRYYLPALIGISCVRGTGRRGRRFRRIPECGYRLEYERKEKRLQNDKYEAIHIKGEQAVRSKPKLLEFRYPDSHLNINQTILTAVLNMSMIAKAMKLSEEGVAHFSQKHFDTVKMSVSDVYCGGTFSDCDLNFVEDLIEEMFEYFRKEISFFTSTQLVKAGIDEISARGFIIENEKDIRTSPIIN